MSRSSQADYALLEEVLEPYVSVPAYLRVVAIKIVQLAEEGRDLARYAE